MIWPEASNLWEAQLINLYSSLNFQRSQMLSSCLFVCLFVMGKLNGFKCQPLSYDDESILPSSGNLDERNYTVLTGNTDGRKH